MCYPSGVLKQVFAALIMFIVGGGRGQIEVLFIMCKFAVDIGFSNSLVDVV